MGKWLMTLLYLAVSVFLTRLIPFSSFFRNLDTTMHEFSHALTALLLSGQVLGIELHSDHSGVTYTRLASSWSSLPVSMSGYIGASLFSLLLFALHRRQAQRLGLALIVAVAAVMLVLFVHGGFGMAWLAIFIALTGTMLFLGPEDSQLLLLAARLPDARRIRARSDLAGAYRARQSIQCRRRDESGERDGRSRAFFGRCCSSSSLSPARRVRCRCSCAAEKKTRHTGANRAPLPCPSSLDINAAERQHLP
ncbi:M50 family metallopeptidase [Cohnella ginsengisoli]|uniref:M50 family metallopeptidase n=1 Tax=Cohnella ginsengisoli TaxID=425004 RepID=UPI0030B90C2D